MENTSGVKILEDSVQAQTFSNVKVTAEFYAFKVYYNMSSLFFTVQTLYSYSLHAQDGTYEKPAML
jgi:hypothetical protein